MSLPTSPETIHHMKLEGMRYWLVLQTVFSCLDFYRPTSPETMHHMKLEGMRYWRVLQTVLSCLDFYRLYVFLMKKAAS
jgi:hypothetical protein